MRNAPESGRIEQSLVFIDRINRIFWIFYFSQSPDETEKAQSPDETEKAQSRPRKQGREKGTWLPTLAPF